jgi:hypothetical protein
MSVCRGAYPASQHAPGARCRAKPDDDHRSAEDHTQSRTDEDRLMERQFPNEYLDHKKRTKAGIPIIW